MKNIQEDLFKDLLESLQNTLSALESFIGNNSNEWAEVKQAKKAIEKALK